MFGLNGSSGDFARDVATEVEYLKTMHGENALAVAREKAARPALRTHRRKILNAAVQRLEGKPERKLLGRLFG
ncbi:hypothetical protein [Caulobacter mirabilis]|uniref:Uncharacterized protein n=1 Tax=Caulobacter mirabilis TaxID=69666 RepID=A0A2D2AZX8_9CAUL|nr:hypothetical protein [Caulobacter mirabilis]ATQ43563.1 hypothetical protein CSW64_14705 [Caulobacter mirabilis]